MIDYNYDWLLLFNCRFRLLKVATQYCRPLPEILGNISDNFADESILSMIKYMSPRFDETFLECKVFGEYRNCSNIFVPVINGDGLCYTFNSLNVRDLYTNK